MLKLVVDKIEDVEEPLRTLYEDKDGKFRLKVDGVEDTSSLHSALRSERASRANLEKKVKAFESLGKSDEEIKQLIEAAEKAETEKAEKAGEFEKLKDALKTQHTKDLKAKDDALAAMRSSLERYLVDAQATSAIAAAKGSSDLLLPHVQKHVRVIEENGDYVVKVVDAKGEPRINGKGEPMSIADLVGEMRQSDVYGRAFEGSGQSGSGMRPANGNGAMPGNKTITRADFLKLSPAEQMEKAKGGFTVTE
ncbi:hypothetical protein [Bradyrhizobium lablabi]|uniref:hypothetical protein n=1 Tax=Bradyrhizobium lablabi TaxID=722472 RepID=UPI001BA6048A|nr:hypothetical protein [Bradyrhizobium lablabi]MBR0693662.1 hypothetical protein [Bradyrhizobium lablabi]